MIDSAAARPPSRLVCRTMLGLVDRLPGGARSFECGRNTVQAATPLRFAVVVDGAFLEAWQADALRRIPETLAVPVVSIDVAAKDRPRHRGLQAVLWDRYRQRLDRPGRALQRRPLGDVIAGVPSVSCAPVDTGAARPTLPGAVVDALRTHDTEFVVNLTRQSVAGLPPALVAHGLWELRVCAPNAGGDEPNGDAASPAPALMELSLVRVGQRPAEDAVVYRGWTRSVPDSLADTVDTTYTKTVEWLARACRDVAQFGHLETQGRPSNGSDLLRAPPFVAMVLRSPWRKLRRVVRAVFMQEEWHVGIVDQPIEQVFAARRLGSPRWLAPPSRRVFLADPFGIDGDDGADTVILAEAFDHLTATGHIAAVDVATDHQRPSIRPAMRTNGHMSYPYLFRHDGEIYCVPETRDQHRAVLHRARRFPDLWDPVAVLVDGLAATDPTVIRHDDAWWLFCTDDDLGPDSNLLLFHSTSLSGPWEPHPRNPVKIDIRSARPAGTPFVVDGRLIRPAQDSASGYGSGVVFNEVEVLSTTAFRERPVFRLAPPLRGPHRFGVHTVAAWGNRTLVDGKHMGPSLIKMFGRGLQLVR